MNSTPHYAFILANIAETDETDKFFDGDEQPADGPPELTEAERESLKEDLRKVEDEIETLRQVLQARMKHAAELKRKLGLTPWNDLSQGLKQVKDSPAYQKSTAVLASTSEAVTSKIGALRNSDTFKSFGASMGNAYGAMKTSASKAKIAASTSIQSISGLATSPNSENEPVGTETKSPLT